MCIHNLCAQSLPALRFNRYTTSDGLSSNTVTSILQDSRGFIWFGTQDGLNRFDGRNFITFKHDPVDIFSVSGNVINDLAEDNNGIIWIGTTDGGLCSYDFRTNGFKTHSFQRSDNVLNFTPNIISVAIDSQQQVWAGVEKVGLYRLNLQTDSFKFLGHESLIAKPTVNDIISDHKGRIYFGAIGSSLNYKDVNGPYTSVSKRSPKFLYPGYTITKIYCAANNEIWCGGWDNGLYRYSLRGDTLEQYLFETGKPFTFSGNELHAISQDQQGMLWLGMKSGDLYLFDPVTKKSFYSPFWKEDAQGLKGSRVYAIYRDRSNRMWVGTDAGVHVYDPLLNPFKVVNLADKLTTGLNLKVMDFLIDNEETLYIGTKAGLLIKTKNSDNFFLKTFAYKNQLLNINKIFRDSRGIIYLGTQSSMFVFDSKKLTLKTVNSFSQNFHYFDFFDIGSSSVNAIAEAVFMNDTVLWVSAYGHGICLFDRNTLHGGIGLIGTLPELQNLIRKILVDSKGRVWMIGASMGLVTDITSTYFSLDDSLWKKNPSVATRVMDSFGRFNGTTFNRSDKYYSLRSNDVFDMVENDDGTFWITTKGSGLYLFNPGDPVKTFTHFNSNHQSLEGIAKDKNGNLWIIAAGGIDFFDMKTKIFFRYDQVYGIPEEGVAGYFYQDDKGYLYAGGNGFCIRFRPEEVKRNLLAPPVFITHFKILDQPADSLLLKRSIHLSYNQNFISFEMAALNFTNAGANQFSYRLENFDKDWIQSSYNNQVTYTNIPPGKYTLQVKASNNDGVWNEEGAALEISIDPPWWRMWWFYLLMVLAIVSALYGIYRYRVNQLLKLQHIRNKIARDLHDDIGSTLGSISFFSEAAKQQLDNNNVSASQKVIEKIGENSRNMIETMSDIVWSVNPENDSVEQLTARMQALASDVLSMQDIRLKFYADEKLKKIKLNMEQRKNVFMVFKEALYNIVKYAECTQVEISIRDTGKKILLEIADNGKGFEVKEVKSYNGNGLKNMRFRAKEIDAEISIDSNVVTGTLISLQFAKL
ncbi:MAG: two-component regulator propeller domain-containing protein [Chitinophagales bacterium]